ncbi:MAG: hypothetical protein ACI83Y_002873, partial [Candidatus Azotimanducaceae bacterium]
SFTPGTSAGDCGASVGDHDFHVTSISECNTGDSLFPILFELPPASANPSRRLAGSRRPSRHFCPFGSAAAVDKSPQVVKLSYR